MVAINPSNGQVNLSNVFQMSYQSDSTFVIDSVPNGHIVALACKDDMKSVLSAEAKDLLRRLGSKEI